MHIISIVNSQLKRVSLLLAGITAFLWMIDAEGQNKSLPNTSTSIYFSNVQQQVGIDFFTTPLVPAGVKLAPRYKGQQPMKA